MPPSYANFDSGKADHLLAILRHACEAVNVLDFKWELLYCNWGLLGEEEHISPALYAIVYTYWNTFQKSL